MQVRRTLPQRHRSLIGAWCFVDHYGPDEVADSGGMSVAPHPHTGLQTVSWLFTGEIEHRDSAGHHAMVRPGELNLMTAGRGISHSEVSTPGDPHAARCPALGGAARRGPAHRPRRSPTTRRTRSPGTAGRRGSSSARCSATRSPVATYTPLLGAELLLEPGTTLALDVDATFEHGVLVDTGVLAVAGVEAKQHELAYVPPGRGPPRAHGVRRPGAGAAARRRAVRRVDRDVVELRGPQPRGDRGVPRRVAGPDHRDGAVVRGLPGGAPTAGSAWSLGDHLPPIPAPALPNARLKERR